MGFLQDLQNDNFAAGVKITLGSSEYVVIEQGASGFWDLFEEAGGLVDEAGLSTEPIAQKEIDEFMGIIAGAAGAEIDSLTESLLFKNRKLETKGDLERLQKQLQIVSELTILKALRTTDDKPVYESDEEKKEFVKAIASNPSAKRKIEAAIASFNPEKKISVNGTPERSKESAPAKS